MFGCPVQFRSHSKRTHRRKQPCHSRVAIGPPQELSGAEGYFRYSVGVSFHLMKAKSFFMSQSLVFLALAVVALTARAEAGRYAGANWAFVDTAKVLAAAADITLAKYPDCDEATVEQKLTRVYHPDGTAECQD